MIATNGVARDVMDNSSMQSEEFSSKFRTSRRQVGLSAAFGVRLRPDRDLLHNILIMIKNFVPATV